MRKCQQSRFAMPLYEALRIVLIVVMALGLACIEVAAQSTEPATAPKTADASGAPAGQQDMGAMARKLNNPLSSIWALQFEFDWNSKKGDITDGSYKDEYVTLFQPLLPVPLTKDWNIIARPVIPYISTEIPSLDLTGLDLDWDRTNGLGDIVMPVLFTPSEPEGHFQLAAGPTFSFPTATDSDLGSQMWEAGPAAAVIYKEKDITAGFLAQYWWDVAGWGDSSVSHGNMLYFFWYMLPGDGHWQIGMNPTINYDHMADGSDQWNVPVGLTVGKMVKLGKLPIKIQLGADYSVVHEDTFGDRWKVKLLITPVIPTFIKKPLFNW